MVVTKCGYKIEKSFFRKTIYSENEVIKIFLPTIFDNRIYYHQI